MIIDLDRFVAEERPYWAELSGILEKLEERTRYTMTLPESQRFYYLYQRCSADLGRLSSAAVEPPVSRYLQSLVARAYGEVHEERQSAVGFTPAKWFFETFPQAFRRRSAPFLLSVAITLAGCLFGAVALAVDPEAKDAIMPFQGLQSDPAQRVAREEKMQGRQLSGQKSGFSAQLITNNTRVAITAMSLGLSWGIGTVVVLFYNGVTLGAVTLDYVRAGQARFLAGWLLPHGVIEIPAIVLAGQAGLLLAGALIGWGKRTPLRMRFREVGPDLVTLIAGVAVMLVWAGIVEAFLSQYHEPVIPYAAKMAFGCVELVLLVLYLSRSGVKKHG
ncbi:MAG: stage II sporulation protein M [Bryobacteraceae bacterium]